MAKKTKKSSTDEVVAPVGMPEGMSPSEISDLLAEVKENYARSSSAEAENRRMFSEDLNFVFNAEDAHAQWDPVILQARRNRPSYTYNRVLQSVNMVYGDFQQVEPQLKVRAKIKQEAVKTATVVEGMIRDIELSSRARRAVYNPQFKYALAGGFGVIRALPEYEHGMSFNQVIRLKGLANPLTAWWDAECQDPYRADAMCGGVAESINKSTYKALYPNFNPQTFDMSRDNRGWVSSDMIRVAEYYKKIPVHREIALLDNGRVVIYDKAFKELQEHLMRTGARASNVKQTRTVKDWEIYWVKCDGFNILEAPQTYKWTKIPIVRVPGRFIAIEGRQKVQSLVRHSKDSQRTYNLHRTTMIESAALTPRSPYLATPKMIKGYEDMWATANTANRPYLLYDIDEDAAEAGVAARPTREPPPDVPAALVQLAQQDLQDIQAAVGYFDASLGSQVNDSDRTSGKALVARQRRGDLGSHEFLDNFAGALEVVYDCLLDMIPTVYDTARVVRIVGANTMEQYVEINKAGADGDIMHALEKDSHDVTCTVGPGYATARQDTLETLLEAATQVPQFGTMMLDVIARNIDTQDSDEMARRARVVLSRQGIVKLTPEEQKDMPPPPPPNPMAQAQLAKEAAAAKKLGAEAAIAASKAQASPLEQRKLIMETAGKHLDNMKTAGEIGDAQAASAAEAQAAGVDLQNQAASGALDLQQQHDQGQLDMAQQQASHAAQLRQTQEAHAAELARVQEAGAAALRQQSQKHSQALALTEQKHQQNLRHQAAKHAQGLEEARAAARVKKSAPK